MNTDKPRPSALAYPVACAVDLLDAPRRMLDTAPGMATDRAGLEEASLLLHDQARAALARTERAVADQLPPLEVRDCRELANHDRELAREVEAYRDARYDLVDVTDLDEDEESSETWTIVAGGSSRYEVREVPRYEARRTGGAGNVEAWIVWDNEENEQAEDFDAAEAPFNEKQARAVAEYLINETPDTLRLVWIVWDTNNNHDARDGDRYAPLQECGQEGYDYDPTDEDSAKEAADRANLEDYRENACGWPFAHNYAAEIEEWEAEDFAAAGFVVARHEPSGKVFAGIDGGGYSFLDAHWSPLFFRRMAKGHGYIRTSKGLRRVAGEVA